MNWQPGRCARDGGVGEGVVRRPDAGVVHQLAEHSCPPPRPRRQVPTERFRVGQARALCMIESRPPSRGAARQGCAAHVRWPSASCELAASAEAGPASHRAPARTPRAGSFGDFRQRVRTSGGPAPRHRTATSQGATRWTRTSGPPGLGLTATLARVLTPPPDLGDLFGTPTWSTTAAACLIVQNGAACGSAPVVDMDSGAARRTRGADEAPLKIEQLPGDFAWPFWGLLSPWPAANDVGVAVLYATPVGCARGTEGR
jgi:hypothetical protein